MHHDLGDDASHTELDSELALHDFFEWQLSVENNVEGQNELEEPNDQNVFEVRLSHSIVAHADVVHSVLFQVRPELSCAGSVLLQAETLPVDHSPLVLPSFASEVVASLETAVSSSIARLSC